MHRFKWDQIGLLQLLGSATSVAFAFGEHGWDIAGLYQLGKLVIYENTTLLDALKLLICWSYT